MDREQPGQEQVVARKDMVLPAQLTPEEQARKVTLFNEAAIKEGVALFEAWDDPDERELMWQLFIEQGLCSPVAHDPSTDVSARVALSETSEGAALPETSPIKDQVAIREADLKRVVEGPVGDCAQGLLQILTPSDPGWEVVVQTTQAYNARMQAFRRGEVGPKSTPETREIMLIWRIPERLRSFGSVHTITIGKCQLPSGKEVESLHPSEIAAIVRVAKQAKGIEPNLAEIEEAALFKEAQLSITEMENLLKRLKGDKVFAKECWIDGHTLIQLEIQLAPIKELLRTGSESLENSKKILNLVKRLNQSIREYNATLGAIKEKIQAIQPQLKKVGILVGTMLHEDRYSNYNMRYEEYGWWRKKWEQINELLQTENEYGIKTPDFEKAQDFLNGLENFLTHSNRRE